MTDLVKVQLNSNAFMEFFITRDRIQVSKRYIPEFHTKETYRPQERDIVLHPDAILLINHLHERIQTLEANLTVEECSSSF